MTTAAYEPKPLTELSSPAERHVAELQRQVEQLEEGHAAMRHEVKLARNVEASLRRELAEAKASERRWTDRIQALEARLSKVIAVASGEAP